MYLVAYIINSTDRGFPTCIDRNLLFKIFAYLFNKYKKGRVNKLFCNRNSDQKSDVGKIKTRTVPKINKTKFSLYFIYRY